MSYPFDDNPLDTYLLKHRELRAHENSLYMQLAECKRLKQNSAGILAQLVSANEKISDLQHKVLIAPRGFDVFKSERDLRIQAFHDENPKPEATQCLHSKTEKRRQRQSNDSQHVVTQCLSCGTNLRHHAKGDFPDWMSYPEVDLTLSDAFHSARTTWYKKRTALLEELPPATDLPEFDHKQFETQYLEEHPLPVDQETCAHPIVNLTLRTYESGEFAVVNQCQACGKHISAVSKSKVENIRLLPAFDLVKGPSARSTVHEWYQNYSEERRAALQEFREQRAQKLESGEIVVTDRTTFGTYYGSPEWTNTRSRILKRDNHCCQVESCTSQAECVHHITYDRLGCENDLDLISLCTECHNIVHLLQDKFPYQYRLTSNEIRWIQKGEQI